MPEKQAHEISHHILAASTTLLGISFAVVSLIGAMGHADKTLADEFALLSLILFLGSCIFCLCLDAGPKTVGRLREDFGHAVHRGLDIAVSAVRSSLVQRDPVKEGSSAGKECLKPLWLPSIVLWSRLIIIVLLGFLLNACAAPPKMRLFRAEPARPEKAIDPHAFASAKGDQVIGRLAVVRVQDGDTLPDIARHFGLGYDEISAANPGVDVWAPQAGSRVILPLMFILPESPRKGIVINLAAMRLFHYGGKNGAVITYPVGIGEEGRSTPMGEMSVDRKAVRPTWYVPASIRRDHQQRGDPLPAEVPPGPDNPLGEYALYLSRATYVIHGTNKPYSIGLRATNGCIRLYPEDMEKLYPVSAVKTPVNIVNEPYLIGRAGGVLYLEAHTPQEELNAGDMKKRLYARLRQIEKKEALRLDWKQIEETVKQARVIPRSGTGGRRRD